MRKGFAEAFEAYDEEAHLAGGMMPIVQQVYRIKVVTAFLRVGIPLNKIDSGSGGILDANRQWNRNTCPYNFICGQCHQNTPSLYL